MHINNIYHEIKLLYNTNINCFSSKYNILYDCNIWEHLSKCFSLNLLVRENILRVHWLGYRCQGSNWPIYDLLPVVGGDCQYKHFSRYDV